MGSGRTRAGQGRTKAGQDPDKAGQEPDKAGQEPHKSRTRAGQGRTRLGPGKVQNFEVRNSQNRWRHENRGEISCRTVVSRGRGPVSLTIS